MGCPVVQNRAFYRKSILGYLKHTYFLLAFKVISLNSSSNCTVLLNEYAND